jgi:hypothetical protein
MRWRSRDGRWLVEPVDGTGPDGRPDHYLRAVRDGAVVGRYASVEELAASPVPLDQLVEDDHAGNAEDGEARSRRHPAGAAFRGGLLHPRCA